MKYLTHSVLALAFGAALALPAIAQEQKKDFQAVDTDTNQQISWEEASAAYPEWTEDAFNGFDANGDGALDQSEYESATM